MRYIGIILLVGALLVSAGICDLVQKITGRKVE